MTTDFATSFAKVATSQLRAASAAWCRCFVETMTRPKRIERHCIYGRHGKADRALRVSRTAMLQPKRFDTAPFFEQCNRALPVTFDDA